ncbi:MAG: RagB/SusD family nutrient uptake outer membrane protein [Bacteroidetes bacterium]|nr:RagB/SusD family nutrient uptake outer membrane protein [Bacteroidota bacterium]
MKNKLYLSIISLFLFFSCDVLDVEPLHSISADEAITSANDIKRAVNGCYDAFQSADYYGRNYLVAGDLTADLLTWTGTTAGYNQINNNSILADNIIVEGIWSSLYTTLNRINNTLHRIPEVTNLTEDEVAEVEKLKGELYFLRALSHFNLVKLFGPVPIRVAPATASDEDLNVPRRSVNDVYEQIFTDLSAAEELITEEIILGRASKAAVLALKARASLYFYFHSNQTSRLVDAVNAATAVIDDFGLEMENDFATLFSGTPNTESIFEIEFNEQDRNRLAEYFFPSSFSGRREFAPTQQLFNSYDAIDVRRDISIGKAGADLYAQKYSDIEKGTDNVYVFRLAEMYLIRAEANALLQIEASLVQSDVNKIRERAELLPVTSTNFQVLLLEIETQRMKEFAFEGHRWFDLVRTGRAITVLENVTNINQTLYPIPLNEILTNTNENMYQNDGY